MATAVGIRMHERHENEKWKKTLWLKLTTIRWLRHIYLNTKWKSGTNMNTDHTGRFNHHIHEFEVYHTINTLQFITLRDRILQRWIVITLKIILTTSPQLQGKCNALLDDATLMQKLNQLQLFCQETLCCFWCSPTWWSHWNKWGGCVYQHSSTVSVTIGPAVTCLFCRLSHLAFLFSALLSGKAFPFWFRCRGVNRFSLRAQEKRASTLYLSKEMHAMYKVACLQSAVITMWL